MTDSQHVALPDRLPCLEVGRLANLSHLSRRPLVGCTDPCKAVGAGRHQTAPVSRSWPVRPPSSNCSGLIAMKRCRLRCSAGALAQAERGPTLGTPGFGPSVRCGFSPVVRWIAESGGWKWRGPVGIEALGQAAFQVTPAARPSGIDARAHPACARRPNSDRDGSWKCPGPAEFVRAKTVGDL